jgi:hypothetical protein
MSATNWSFGTKKKESLTRKFLSYASVLIRNKQYMIFCNELRPNRNSNILDIGMTPNEELVDSNFFEKKYPFPNKLTAASVEDCTCVIKKYPKIKFKKIKPNNKLPYKDNQFDILVSWATLEHVGTRKHQEFFISECIRVAKKVFITTPNKDFPLEFHTDFLFLHYLPHQQFSNICSFFGKKFWGNIKNLNLLTKGDVVDIIQDKKVKVRDFKPFGPVASHLLIIKK